MANYGPDIQRRRICIGLCAIAGAWTLDAIGGERDGFASTIGIASPVADVVVPKLRDTLSMRDPGQVFLGGWLGARVELNATRRLKRVDLEPLLAGYRNKPGQHPWIGEHIGKWIHAATLAWAYTGDAALKHKLDDGVRALIATQEPDGYLGTYTPDKRFRNERDADWDVWSSKYCMIGLLEYHRRTGDRAALDACRKTADLLIATFPSQRSILAAGAHQGMAATSVLEPVVRLYRATGDRRYLDFARYIVGAWDEAGGPDIVDALNRMRKVRQVANGKAYEMLSNLVGLCEFARVVGETRWIDAVEIAWRDIVDTQLYVSGTTSHLEHFQTDAHMREEEMPHIGETCVTVTWIQLNQSLLTLTGNARYAVELERTHYNALSAAQHPQGEDWTYFTPLNGEKKYDADITCCHSSGPRGMALAPLTAYFLGHDGESPTIHVNTLETSSARFDLDGHAVYVRLKSDFPYRGSGGIHIRADAPARFGLRFRVPDWAQAMRIRGAEIRDGWASLAPRRWRDGDSVRFAFDLDARLVPGQGFQAGREYQYWGPFLLACDRDASATDAAIAGHRYAGPARRIEQEGASPMRFRADVVDPAGRPAFVADLLAFADAGVGGRRYRTWLPLAREG